MFSDTRQKSENTPTSSSLSSTETFPSSPADAVERFNASGSSPADIIARATRRQQQNIGQFELSGGQTTVMHMPNSVTGIIRLPETGEVANTYWNAYKTDSGHVSIHTGAAQGVNEEYHLTKNKYKKTKNHDYVEEQLLSHLATALLAHMVQYESNQDTTFLDKLASGDAKLQLTGYKPPAALQISNYMTDLWFPLGDGALIAPRKRFIKQLEVTLKKPDSDEARLFRQRLSDKMLELAAQKGLLVEGPQEEINKSIKAATEAVLQPGKLIFNRQGLNAFRILASWSSSTPLLGIAEQKIRELHEQKKASTDAHDRDRIQSQIDKIESTTKAILNVERRYQASQLLSNVLILPMVMSIAVNRYIGSVSNSALHKEALKLNLINLIDAADIGGCQSAKDRFGALLCLTRAQEDYIDRYGAAPPLYGLLGFIPGFINLFYPFFKNYTDERQAYLKERFAEHWVSGALQYVADANAPGAVGLKNNSQVVPAAYREAVNQKVEEQIMAHYKNLIEALKANPDNINDILKNSSDMKQIQYLTLCFPAVSEQLANINSIIKKSDEGAEKKAQEIQTKCARYLKPVLEDIFKITHQSLPSASPQEIALRNSITAAILAEATRATPYTATLKEEQQVTRNPISNAVHLSPPNGAGVTSAFTNNAEGAKKRSEVTKTP
jgi:hypothetical protein